MSSSRKSKYSRLFGRSKKMAAPMENSISQRFWDLLDFARTKLPEVDTSSATENGLFVSDQAMEITSREALAKREMIAKLISSALGLACSIGFTYLAIKYMKDAMDPTAKEKQKAREKVQFKYVLSENSLCKYIYCVTICSYFHFACLLSL